MTSRLTSWQSHWFGTAKRVIHRGRHWLLSQSRGRRKTPAASDHRGFVAGKSIRCFLVLRDIYAVAHLFPCDCIPILFLVPLLRIHHGTQSTLNGRQPLLSSLTAFASVVLSLAFMDDLERIPVRVKHIGGVVSRIVFHSCPRRDVVPRASRHCRPVEFIDLTIAFGHEPPMNGRWIRLALLDPEERPFAIAEPPQIRMIAFTLVG